MLKRFEYLDIIEEIRNTDLKSIDEFIEKVLEPLRKENDNFIEILYKDIFYLIKDIDKDGENELKIKDGNLVVENGGIQLTGYQSRLHNLSNWLHMEIVLKFIEENPSSFMNRIEDFEEHFLKKPNYTPEYKSQLDRIKRSLKKERKQNLGERESLWEKIYDLNNLELKPNFAGIGINLDNFIEKFKQ